MGTPEMVGALEMAGAAPRCRAPWGCAETCATTEPHARPGAEVEKPARCSQLSGSDSTLALSRCLLGLSSLAPHSMLAAWSGLPSCLCLGRGIAQRQRPSCSLCTGP